ncbi:hypothetical protein [Streptomyces griseorubiginosus]|uniref:hypothetical protein n=1 Tax=Streptomyces griseorubiginosus TaxID=67304 RepID=UPI0013C4B3CB|nr:hypothetical protein [Streptomyces griseorubiginosus]
MNEEPLIKAVVAAMLLLEQCGPDEVDPDTAVRGLENIGYELLKFTEVERVEFMNLIERVASSESDPHVAEFTRNVPFAIGMVEGRWVGNDSME